MSTPAPGIAGWDLTRQRPRPYVPDPCRCDQCKYGQRPPEPGKDALLYYGPGVVDRTWQARVRTGQWDDIPAAFDTATARVHLAAAGGSRKICRDIETEGHHIAAMFGANPSLHFDARVARGLREVEERLAAELDGMRAAAAQREAAARTGAWLTGEAA